MKYEETARRLRKAMDDAGITAAELSKKSGIGKSSISHYVNGSHVMGNIAAYEIGHVLGVEPMWLMGFNDIIPFAQNDDTFIALYLQQSEKTKKRIARYLQMLLEEDDE